MAAFKVDPEVISALSDAEITGNSLRLVGELPRSLYVATNKILEAAGGKWDRKARAHLFDDDPSAVVDEIILTGVARRTKQDFGQFDSPTDVVARLIELAQIMPSMKVLEPSAGRGGIVAAARRAGGNVFAYELDEKRFRECQQNHFISGGIGLRDFLSVDPAPIFDRVVMNPPFAGQADTEHVTHAVKFLRPGGRLVSVMSLGAKFRTNRRATAFRAMTGRYGAMWENLPENAFATSGTQVRTCIVSFEVP